MAKFTKQNGSLAFLSNTNVHLMDINVVAKFDCLFKISRNKLPKGPQSLICVQHVQKVKYGLFSNQGRKRLSK